MRYGLEAPTVAVIKSMVDMKKFRLPELERNSVSLAQIGNEKEVSRGQNLPYLAAVGDYGFTNNSVSDLASNRSAAWSVGLQLTIPIFSGLSP